MKVISTLLLAFCLFSPFAPLKAQKDSLPDLYASLNTLNAEQQRKVLDYAHYLGAYYGKSLEVTCKLLDEKNQERVARYISVLKNTGKPEPTTIRWEREVLPFGEMEEGHIMLDSFMVINTGTAPYIIQGTKSSCDCSVLYYPEFPVMPGDSAMIRIEFDSSNKAGRAKPGMVLYDNSRPNRRSILYLDGYIKPRNNVKTIIRH